MSTTYRLAILNTHPIQYFAPLYQRLARDREIDLTVFFASKRGAVAYRDPGFGQVIQWDRALLEGYRHVFLGDSHGETHSFRRGRFLPPIVAELRNGLFDAVLLHGYNYRDALAALVTARVLGIPAFIRGDTQPLLYRTALRRLARALALPALYSQFAGCLAVGTRNRDFYQTMGVSPSRLFSVPFTVDNDHFRTGHLGSKERAEVRKRLGLPPQLPIVLYVGKIHPAKRPLDLLDAIAGAQAAGRHVGLVFAGSGPFEQAVRAATISRGVRDVYFLGFKNQTELPAVYGTADIFAFPAENEAWGLVLNEALCAGLPVVCSREVGAVPDLVHHAVNGFTFEPGDTASLRSYIERLVDDPDLRHRMGTESSRIINTWGLHETCEGIKQAVRTCCKRPA